MLLSLNWLKEFTPYGGPIDDLAHALTMLGLEVEEIFDPFEGIKDIIVGKVVECSPHPRADKLSLCRVDLGTGELVDIVCGAPNVDKGQFVPVAPVGSTLPSGMKIKKAKIRGTYSHGMICSERELGLGEDHSGIMVLEGNPEPGERLRDFLDLDTTVLDIGMTPNRADCLSVLGIAREVAAYFDLPLNIPSTDVSSIESEEATSVEIEIRDPEDCPLYMAREIRGVKIGPSPSWMRYRLVALGLRPINNVVDITNYVLLEFGHPLHGFDRGLLKGNTIAVARPDREVSIRTLDGQERRVSSHDILIWDSERPVALAGIMGGEETEINESTEDVLLECAIFNPSRIRRTARRMGLSTEASYRFERGVDQLGAERAINRAAYLIHRFAGGRLLRGVAKKEPKKWTAPSIPFRPLRAKRLLCVDVDEAYCLDILGKLGCKVEKKGEGEYKISPPSYRLDLEREIDLVEEIGRFYGLEKIPAVLPGIKKSLERGEDSPQVGYEFLFKIKQWARGIGLQEAITYSFVGREEMVRFGAREEEMVSIQNPLASDQDTMRCVVVAGLLNVVKTNLGRLNRDLHLFEVARTFVWDEREETGVKETNKLAIVLEGRRHPRTWAHGKDNWDFYDIKAMVEHLFSTFEIEGYEYEEIQERRVVDRAVKILLDGREMGFMGRLIPSLAEHYHAKDNLWLCEIDLDLLFAHYIKHKTTFKEWSKFPPVYRDMTLVCPPEVRFKDILGCVKEAKTPLLEEISLIDVYEPPRGGERNLTIRMTYRHSRKNLTDREVDKVHGELGRHIIKRLPVRFP